MTEEQAQQLERIEKLLAHIDAKLDTLLRQTGGARFVGSPMVEDER